MVAYVEGREAKIDPVYYEGLESVKIGLTEHRRVYATLRREAGIESRARPRTVITSGIPGARGGREGWGHRLPTASFAQYPRSGVGISPRRHALARPTSETSSRLASVRMDSLQTRSVTRLSVQVVYAKFGMVPRARENRLVSA